MHNIENKLTQVQESITSSALNAGRRPEEITLLAVSKKKPAADIRGAYEAGQRDFGENYLQESLQKSQQLKDLDINWHFIGALQSNKAGSAAELFSWVHTVDRLKIAKKLSQHRPIHLPPLQICIQVNIDNSETKAGCSVEEVTALARSISELPQLKLRGLMAIPSPNAGMSPFKDLKTLLEDVRQSTGLDLDTLSMGMSSDMHLAIEAGATIVRVGTAIFGQR